VVVLGRGVPSSPRVGPKVNILRRHNEKDLDDLPEEAREKMEFILVDTVDEVLKAALGNGFDRATCRVSDAVSAAP
jgi:ATP-dependent Lon protease